MNKRNKIIYWIATIWMALGMGVSGVMQIIQPKEEMETIKHLGYPLYFFTIIGIWKILGLIVILIPNFKLVKEWAYAGFFFIMSGAIISHAAISDVPKEFFGPILLLILTIISWYFRAENKKINISLTD